MISKNILNNKRIIIGIVIIIAALGLIFAGYVGNYYHASDPVEALSDTENVNVIKTDTGYLYDGPGDDFEGLALLAAYTATDLSDLDIRTVNIYGTRDSVLNMDKLGDSYDLMPEDSRAVQIEGGNHAQFGDYGEQNGDGTAEISRDEQQHQTVDAIISFIKEDK